MDTFQLSLQAAEGYESKFVPAIFGEWAVRLVDAAGVAPGEAVLDVACGTGIVRPALASFQTAGGTLALPIEGHVISASPTV